MVIDCPPGPEFQSFMASSGIAHITDLVISHAHKDHLGGLAALYRSGVEIDRIWICDDQANKTEPYELVRRVFAEARRVRREKGLPPITRGYPHAEQEGPLLSEAQLEFLAPLHESVAGRASKDTNRLSVVVRILYKGEGVALLPGDLDYGGFQEFMTEMNPDMRARWLVAPHHGGLAGTSQQTIDLMKELLAATGAPNVFFSFAGNGQHGHPREEVVLAVTASPGQAAVRCSQMARKCLSESDSVATVNWPTCAGTVALRLDAEPHWNESNHDAFVSSLASPMCRREPSRPPAEY